MSQTYERVMELAGEKGVDAAYLDNLLGTYRGRVDSWSSGRYAPRYQELTILANYFGVTLDYLLGKSNERKPPQPELMDGVLPERKPPAPPAGGSIRLSNGKGGVLRVTVPPDKVERLLRLLEAGFPELLK